MFYWLNSRWIWVSQPTLVFSFCFRREPFVFLSARCPSCCQCQSTEGNSKQKITYWPHHLSKIGLLQEKTLFPVH